MIGKIRATIITLRRGLNMVNANANIAPSLESSYRHLFLRDLRRLRIEDDFYPVGGGANYGLMYLVTRCAMELPLSRVLEFGAGQTTVLLHRLKAATRAEFRIDTIEHDAYWARAVGERTGVELTFAPLIPTCFGQTQIQWYDACAVASVGSGFDMIIVDGPPAHSPSNQYNRLGFAGLVPRLLAKDCVIIIDDAHRTGETALVDACKSQLQGWTNDLAEGAVVAAKRQHIFACGSYGKAAFF